MTLAAPISRRGRLTLVLAIIAAVVAVGGWFVWSNQASANIAAGATVVATDNSAGGPLVPGEVVIYTFAVTAPGGSTGTMTNTQLNTSMDDGGLGGMANAFPVAATSGVGGVWQSGECSVQNDVDERCNDATGPVTSDEMTVTAVIMPRIDYFVFPPLCTLKDDSGVGNRSCTTGIGVEDIIPPVSPLDATNGPNQPETFTFHQEAGFTCASDASQNNGQRNCQNSDFSVVNSNGATATITGIDFSGCPVALNSACDIAVTINSPTQGSVAVHMAWKWDPQSLPNQEGFIDLVDVVGTKTYDIGGPGDLRHLDAADRLIEDAAGTTDSDPLDTASCGTTRPCGLITPQDDSDDATGSFHEACIEGTNLLAAANNADITWTIQNGPGGNTSVNPGPAGLKVAGPNGEPCVQWGSGGTGTQTITARYDNHLGDSADFFWDGVSLPLIKEWNHIDSTKIVAAAGDVGATLDDNTLDLGDWADRDCSFTPVDAGFCTNPNLDTLTLNQECLPITTPGPGFGQLNCAGRSFIEYAIGSHNDIGGVYDGPIDGAAQTFTVSGDCGAVRLEDPSGSAGPFVVTPGGSRTVNSSDKGIGFEIVPNGDGDIQTTPSNANCGPSSCVTVTIDTSEANLFHSPPLVTTQTETITVCFVVGPPTNKTPILAWAGQRVVLEHDWADYSSGTRECPNYVGDVQRTDEFGVLYTKQAGPGSFTAEVNGIGESEVAITGSDVLVDVDRDPVDGGPTGVRPESDCISRIIYESQDQGQVDIVAFATDNIDNGTNLSNASPLSQQVAFVIYYMKLEDVTLGLVPGTRADHNSGDFTPTTEPVFGAVDPATGKVAGDVTTITSNVSADVLARVRVRGWTMTDNCPARASGVDSNSGFLPANRCIWPDDWGMKAGGTLATEERPNYDIMTGPGESFLTDPYTTLACQEPIAGAAGPFSLLDGTVRTLVPVVAPAVPASLCGDSNAPHVAAGFACLSPNQTSCRETVFPSGTINSIDGPMPPALIRLLLTGSGFIRPADKSNVYLSNSNLFYDTHIPAEPWITPINSDLSGYQWNTWGVGGKSGLYHFWTSLADSGTPVVSCPGADSVGCAGGVATGGFDMIKIYSDNHGEAMAWLNGDAKLTFSGCTTSAPFTTAGGSRVVQLNGYYCNNGVTVGTSTLTASADYPDKRKHYPLDSNDVTVTWTWGGTKEVTTVVDPANLQFAYVVFHVTDRDGFCGNSPSLHPVLGEQVDFLIDSTDGVITPDATGNAAYSPPVTNLTDKTATVVTFDTAASGTFTPSVTLTTALDAATTSVVYTSTGNPIVVGNVIIIGSEQMLVTAVDTATMTLTVQRGYAGSTAAAHDAGVAIDPVTVSGSLIRPTLVYGECQAWIHITSSLLHSVNVLVTAYDPEGTVTFDVTYNNATPTPVPPTPAPTASPVPPNLWGDIDCNGDVSSIDSLKTLRSVVHLPFDQVGACFLAGSSVHVDGTARVFGDVNCDGSVNAVDALDILLFVASMPGLPASGCPPVGAHVTITS